MKDPIAQATYELAVSDQGKRSIVVQVGRPTLDPRSHNGDWCCELEILWTDGSVRSFRLLGADSFGAMRAAFQFFDIEIKKLKEQYGTNLTYLGSSELV